MNCIFLDQFPKHRELLVETPSKRRFRLKSTDDFYPFLEEGQRIALEFDYKGRVKNLRTTEEELTPVEIGFVGESGKGLLFKTTEDEYVLLSRARVAGLPKSLGIKGQGRFLNFQTDLDGRVCEMTFEAPAAPVRNVPVRRYEG